MSFPNPIDMVYLWVDGSDPKWLMKKEQYLQKEEQVEKKLAVPERWQDNEELRYSLRSVECYAPWVNHIYIVTDNQCPKWLDCSHPKITIVDHKEFIPPEFLPLFAADGIESFLPLIPGLSEFFLYANDDMFFGRPVEPEDFFSKSGHPKVQVKKLYTEDFANDINLQNKLLATTQYASRARANIMVSNLFGNNMNWEGGHVIDPYRKSYMLEVLNEPSFVNEWNSSRKHRFRSPEAVQRIIFSLYDASKGRTVLKDGNRFRELRRIFSPATLPMLLCKQKDLQKTLKIRPKMFCYYIGDYYDQLQDFFHEYYPEKSSFEK